MIYSVDNGTIQDFWKEFAKRPNDAIYSYNHGASWHPIPSMDSGKWAMFTLKDGQRIEWIFSFMD